MFYLDDQTLNMLISLSKTPGWERLPQWMEAQREVFVTEMIHSVPPPHDCNYALRMNIFQGMCTVLDVMSQLFRNPQEASELIKKIDDSLEAAKLMT